jgi:tetratricopeptide (TPR) repeat protein/transcriptional regulator with XRE-family HTH domain
MRQEAALASLSSTRQEHGMPEQPGERSDFAVALNVLRLVKGLGKRELATASGVSYDTIAKLERGRRQPRRATVQALVRALGADSSLLDAAVGLVRRGRGGAPPGAGLSIAGGDPVEAEGSAVREVVELQELLRARLADGGGRVVALPFEESRLRAPALWTRLAPYPHATRCALVEEGAEFHDAGLCEHLCDLSIDSAGDSAERARGLAELAVLAAERLPGDAGWQQRVEGFCRKHLGNALRVGGTLAAAAEEFDRAAEPWQRGAAHDPGLLNEARALSLEASLRRDQGDARLALVLLDRALSIDRWGMTAALLIAKATAFEVLGDFEGAIAMLRKAAPLLDCERNTRDLFLLHLNLAVDLCHLRQYRAAEQALPEIRGLALRLGNQLDNLRVAWLEARLAAGRGRVEDALAGFEEVRSGFERQDIHYDAALVTLEMAELYAGLGRTAEVKELARRSAPIFQEQRVHREAQRALALFQRAAEEERVTVRLVRRILDYLERSRRNPRLRYQELA